MPTDIKLKNSVTATNAPTSLQQGEVAINITDKKVWVGNAATTPVLLLGSGADGTFTNLTVSGVASFADGTVSLPSITNIGDTNTGIFFPAADTIAFTEGGVEAMRITSAGEVNINSSANYGGLLSVNRAQTSSVADLLTLRCASSGNLINFQMFGDPSSGTSARFGWTGGYLAFRDGTTERMRIDSVGNVGIGETTAGSYRLNVKTSASQGIFLNGTGTGGSWMAWANSGTVIGYLGSAFHLATSGSASDYSIRSEANLVFCAGGATERMRINAAGNVGIGTSTPSFKLAVSGSDSTYIGVTSSSGGTGSGLYTANATNAYFIGAGAASGGSGLEFRDATNGVTRMVIDASGNVGIGTSSPAATLNVNGPAQFRGSGGSFPTAGSGIEIVGAPAGNTNFIQAYNRTGSTWQNLNIASALTTFDTNGAERMRIDSSGRLLVGGTATIGPGKITAYFSGSVEDGIDLKNTNAGNTGSFVAFFNSTNGVAGSISQNTATGVLYNITSDYRLKTVIAPVSDSGTRLDALQPIEYDWKSNGERTRGFLAHQFAEVYPSSVSGEKDAVDKDGKPVYQGMQASTPEVMADLIAEIQSLRKRVAQLEFK